jgi:hypothetical protein
LSAFNYGVIRLMCLDPGPNREHVDALFRADTGDRDVDRIDDLRRRAVELDNGEPAVDSGINILNSSHNHLRDKTHRR